MSIGIFSIIIFFITILVINRPEKILLAIVFFSPFCASSVISFHSFFLQPDHYFLFAYLGISFFLVILKCHGRLKTDCGKSSKVLFGFVLFSFISIILSALMRIDVPVYGIGNKNQLKSSLVSLQNFTQFLYLFMGYILYLIIFDYVYSNSQNEKKVMNVLVNSGIAVLSIGLYQLIAEKFHLPYDQIFRNSVKTMWQTKQRIQATFGEASFFGQYCVYLMAIYSTYNWTHKKAWRAGLLAFAIPIAVMSRSTTFLFGFIGVIGSYVLLKKLDRRTAMWYMGIICVGPILLYYLVTTNIYVKSIVDSAVAKLALESRSGVERSTIFKHMLHIGFTYPIMGIGYGGGRSTDLYANLLSNVGFIGIFLFLGFVIKDLFILLRNRKHQFALTGILLLAGFLITSCSIPDLSYLPIWVLFGVIDAKCVQFRNRKVTTS